MDKLIKIAKPEYGFSAYLWEMAYNILQEEKIQRDLIEGRKTAFPFGLSDAVQELFTAFCFWITSEDNTDIVLREEKLRQLWTPEVQDDLEDYCRLKSEREIITQEYKRKFSKISQKDEWILDPSSIMKYKKHEFYSFADIPKEEKSDILEQDDYLILHPWLIDYYINHGEKLAKARKYPLETLEFSLNDSISDFCALLSYVFKLVTQKMLIENYEKLFDLNLRKKYMPQTLLYEQFLIANKQREMLVWSTKEIILFDKILF